MKMHTKTDFAGAVRELLGIVAAQILTTALQVCVCPYIPYLRSSPSLNTSEGRGITDFFRLYVTW